MDWSDEELKAFRADIYKDLCRILEEDYKLTSGEVIKIGEVGNKLFDAEFLALGPPSYMTSVTLPIRNAWFGYQTVFDRWTHWIQKVELVPPILDYGCGVGYGLAYLSFIMEGEPELYGLEPMGVQWNIS